MLTEGYDRAMITDAPRICRAASLGIGLILLAGCSLTNHHLIHPSKTPPQVVVWSADFARDNLQVHIEGARPSGVGPFPTVIVHPEEEETSLDMHGVIWDLASRGYVAIAADYHRRIDGKFRRNMFAWRSTGDITLIIDAASSYPEVDQSRIGAIGFSEGGVVSLLMAAHDPDRIKAVVAYYPITDFPHWYAGTRSGFSSRLMFALGRWQMRVESGAPDEEEFQRMLRLASPLGMAEFVRAPVLFVHGAEDTMIPLDESERMAASLKASGATTELLVVPDVGRFFNFRQTQQATLAWNATLAWLDRYLHPTPVAGR